MCDVIHVRRQLTHKGMRIARRNIVELQSLSRSLVSTVQLKHLNFSTELEHALRLLDLLPGQPSEDPYARSTRVLQRLSTVRHPGPRSSMGFDASTEYLYRKLSYTQIKTALVVRSLAYCPGTFLHYNVW